MSIYEEEDCALIVLTTVASHAGSERAIVDAGAKALSLDRGAHGLGIVDGHGIFRRRPDLRLTSLSEEHGWLALDPGAEPTIGERLEVIPNHACPVVANFESLILTRGGEPIETWPVASRGRMT